MPCSAVTFMAHSSWVVPLSPITMATAAMGRHWSLYNIPKDTEAKSVGGKEEPRRKSKGVTERKKKGGVGVHN